MTAPVIERWLRFIEAGKTDELDDLLDGLTVEGIDMIHWNDDGKITSVKVMIRPLKALQAIVPKMGELLETH